MAPIQVLDYRWLHEAGRILRITVSFILIWIHTLFYNNLNFYLIIYAGYLFAIIC